jgi:ATP-dependent DNA ligase
MPCTVKVFDILMLNGNCLTSYTLRKRHEVLYSKKGEYRVFQPVQGRLELADVWEGKDASDIKDRLEWVMENRYVRNIAGSTLLCIQG